MSARSIAALGVLVSWAWLLPMSCSTSTQAPSSPTPSPPPAPDGAAACPPQGVDPTEALLPQGKPCAPEAPLCELTVSSIRCPQQINTWTCGCKDEVWDCVITGQGGAVCVDAGKYCNDFRGIPNYGISGDCFGCCEGTLDNFYCFNNSPEPVEGGGCGAGLSPPTYSSCYCACDPTDHACLAQCEPLLTPGCASCFTELAACMRGPCANVCSGQTPPSTGVAQPDGSSDSMVPDAPLDAGTLDSAGSEAGDGS